MKVRSYVALAAVALLAAPTVSWAGKLTCLSGTDPSVAGDLGQIAEVRTSVDTNCLCAKYDGSPGTAHGDYLKCAKGFVAAGVSSGGLRKQCKGTVTSYYSNSTCGFPASQNKEPCVTKSATGKVKCAVKPVAKCAGAACPNATLCIDAADSNKDGFIDAGDSGECVPIGGDRPVTVHVPPSYSPGTPMPLVVMLHGYGASGALEEAYLGLTSLSDQRGFLYAYPDGTVDQTGARFWNATPACCNFFGASVDDSEYLSGVIASVASRYSVDAKRVYIVGHSNGGFMAYRMACDHAGQIAAIASLAGTMFDDISSCSASSPVSVLHIHGTADATILYNGSVIGANAYPGAATTVADWVSIDGCTNVPDLSAPALDLVNTLPGAETTVTQYAAECAAGSTVELWTMEGGTHIPFFTPQFAPDLIDFLFAHPKP